MTPFAEELTRISHKDSILKLRAVLRKHIAKITSLPENEIENDTDFQDMGLDSLTAFQLITQLKEELGEQFVPQVMVIFDHPTIELLTDHILKLISPNATNEEEIAEHPEVTKTIPQRKDVSKEMIFEVIKKNIRDVLPDLADLDIKRETLLIDLGLNSLDKADIVIRSMQDLNLSIPLRDLENFLRLDDLVNFFFFQANPQ